tara:strand:+ start:485 stop:1117 length:633 start_codon:yes stop_codon:yes gene_type:complete
MGISIYQQGKWVNKIFKQYKVIDDVAEIIQKKVHNDQMKAICWVIKKMFDNEWGGHFYRNDGECLKERARRCREFVNKKENKHFAKRAFVGDITEKYLIMNILLYDNHDEYYYAGNREKTHYRYNNECIYHPSFSVDGIYKYRIHELCKGDNKKFWKTIYLFRVNKLYGKMKYTNSKMKEILDENEWSYNSKAKKIDLVNLFWKSKDNEW